jgi:hypothetical protein
MVTEVLEYEPIWAHERLNIEEPLNRFYAALQGE